MSVIDEPWFLIVILVVLFVLLIVAAAALYFGWYKIKALENLAQQKKILRERMAQPPKTTDTTKAQKNDQKSRDEPKSSKSSVEPEPSTTNPLDRPDNWEVPPRLFPEEHSPQKKRKKHKHAHKARERDVESDSNSDYELRMNNRHQPIPQSLPVEHKPIPPPETPDDDKERIEQWLTDYETNKPQFSRPTATELKRNRVIETQWQRQQLAAHQNFMTDQLHALRNNALPLQSQSTHAEMAYSQLLVENTLLEAQAMALKQRAVLHQEKLRDEEVLATLA